MRNILSKSATEQFEIQQEVGIQSNVVRIRFLLDGEYVGSITAVKSHDDTYAVRYANCTLRGSGKLLYYTLMDAIYPMWLSPDGYVTEDAARVWNGIYNCCEKQVSTEIHQLENEDEYLGYKARFTYKT